MSKLILTREERTQAVLDYFRGLECEFYMLKGLVCLDAACLEGAKKKTDSRTVLHAEYSQFGETFNGIMIATRMDELRTELRLNETKAAPPTDAERHTPRPDLNKRAYEHHWQRPDGSIYTVDSSD